jgi:hypothetical protein
MVNQYGFSHDYLGKVNVFEYKNTKFTLVGTEYQQLPIKNLYKLLSYTKPSIMLLQLRPDQILKSIDIAPKNEKTAKFSNRGYFSQIVHPGIYETQEIIF